MAWWLVWVTWVAPMAAAQDADCGDGFGPVQLRAGLEHVAQQLSNVELAAAQQTLATHHRRVHCIREPIDPKDVARLAQLWSVLAFFDQDQVTSVQWAQLAAEADPSLAPPAFMPPGGAYDEMVELAEDPPLGHPPGMTLAPPRGGAMVLNGELLQEAVWLAEVPAFVQVFDRKGEWVTSFFQSGAAFPAEWLQPGDEPAKVPRWWTGAVRGEETGQVLAASPSDAPPAPARAPRTSSQGSVARLDRGERKRSVPLMITAGGLAVASGALAVAAVIGQGQWQQGVDSCVSAGDCPQDPEGSFEQQRSLVNNLGFAAQGTAVLAVGLGVVALTVKF